MMVTNLGSYQKPPHFACFRFFFLCLHSGFFFRLVLDPPIILL